MTAALIHMTSGTNGGEEDAQPTIAGGVAKALLDFAVRKGAGRLQLIERSRIAPADLADQNARIPLPKYRALMQAGKELCRDPALALHFGEGVRMAEMSIVAPICEASDTAADALIQVNRLSRLLIDDGGRGSGNRFRVTRGDAGLWVELTADRSINYPELTESSFARIASEFRRRYGDEPFARAVHFKHEEPAYRAEYERILRAPLAFGSGKNALLMDAGFLSRKFAPSNPHVLKILSAHADTLLESLASSKTMTGRVEQLLTSKLHAGGLNMGSVARRLGLSRQTLYRRLKAEGASFQALLDDLRRRTALQSMRDDASVKEAAARVGYSDPSVFSRAFKRWTGTRPSAARRAPAGTDTAP